MDKKYAREDGEPDLSHLHTVSQTDSEEEEEEDDWQKENQMGRQWDEDGKLKEFFGTKKD